jgi:hypothetical protein
VLGGQEGLLRRAARRVPVLAHLRVRGRARERRGPALLRRQHLEARYVPSFLRGRDG